MVLMINLFVLCSNFLLFAKGIRNCFFVFSHFQNYRTHWLSVAFGWQRSTSLAYNGAAALRSGGLTIARGEPLALQS
jgi:hypothetical protein